MAELKVHIPEVIEPDENLPPDLIALRRFAWLMDEAIAIPGTRMRVGVDAGLGLIPGVGDAIAAVLSTWVIAGALRHRVPMRYIVRMVVNILIDLGVGSIPLLGDVFDFLFEENVMNLQLLLRHRDRTRPPRRLSEIAVSVLVIIAIIAVFALLLLFGLIASVIWLIRNR
ncbi:MAG: hypothetical protein QOI24_3877 [Acidobacteriota bacterium]|nr:hypothetical protein [Acidobacteriota bacterium]